MLNTCVTTLLYGSLPQYSCALLASGLCTAYLSIHSTVEYGNTSSVVLVQESECCARFAQISRTRFVLALQLRELYVDLVRLLRYQAYACLSLGGDYIETLNSSELYRTVAVCPYTCPSHRGTIPVVPYTGTVPVLDCIRRTVSPQPLYGVIVMSCDDVPFRAAEKTVSPTLNVHTRQQ